MSMRNGEPDWMSLQQRKQPRRRFGAPQSVWTLLLIWFIGLITVLAVATN